MYFTLTLENESGEQVNLSTTANQYMTSKIEGLNPRSEEHTSELQSR